MKYPPRTGSLAGTGGYSRQISRCFLSRACLNRPLPTVPRPACVHLTVRLEVVLRKAVAE